MRIIDPHVHVWPGLPALSWAPEAAVPPTADTTSGMLLDLMAGNGVERTVSVQVICGLLCCLGYSQRPMASSH